MLGKTGQVVDFFWSYSSGGASIFQGRLGHIYPIKKSGINVDDFCQELNLKPGLIKIDVEGAEFEVLLGMAETAQKNKLLIHVELHSWEEMEMMKNAGMVLQWTQKVGYRMVYLRTLEDVTDAGVLAKLKRCHVLLLPTAASLPAGIEKLDLSNL